MRKLRLREVRWLELDLTAQKQRTGSPPLAPSSLLALLPKAALG